MMQTKVGTYAAGAFVVLAASAAAARADDLLVPQDYATIDVASMAAQPGDRIVVRGRVPDVARLSATGVTLDLRAARLDSRLEVTAPGVTIVGGRLKRGIRITGYQVTLVRTRVSVVAPATASDVVPIVETHGARTTLDGVRIKASTRARVVGVEADGEDLAIQGSSIAGGAIGVRASGDGTEVTSSRFSGQWEIGVMVVGDDARVADSSFARAGDQAIFGDGGNAQIVGNAVTGSILGISVAGDTPTVDSNRVDVDDSGVGIALLSGSDGASVSGNDVAGSGGAQGIRVMGDAVVLDGNTVRGENAGTSIDVRGDGCSVTQNSVSRAGEPAPGATGNGIVVRGSQNVVADNGVSDSAGGFYGVWADGTGNQIRGNDVSGCGSGVVVCGCANRVDANTVRDVDTDGIVVVGAETVVSDPDVANAGRCGVLLYGATSVVGGNVRSCGEGGIVALADGSTVDACGLDRNRTGDVVALGQCAVTGVDPDSRIVTDPAQVPDLVQVRDVGFTPPWPVPFPVIGGD